MRKNAGFFRLPILGLHNLAIQICPLKEIIKDIGIYLMHNICKINVTNVNKWKLHTNVLRVRLSIPVIVVKSPEKK